MNLNRTLRTNQAGGGDAWGGCRCRRAATSIVVRAELPPKEHLPSDPVSLVQWGGRLPSTRRAVGSIVSATFIALGGNFFNVTSGLLSLDGGEFARKTRLDVVVPVLGFKRCVDYTNGYEFEYPAVWLADQTIAQRAAIRAERSRAQGALPPLSRGGAERQVAEPTSAFGPAGSTGEENVSVIVAPIGPGFVLESLGSAEEAAARFLATIVPEDSGLRAELLGARSRSTADGQQLYYEMEYVVQGPKFNRHNMSTFCSRGDVLVTFNVQCPQALWEKEEQGLRHAAASFRLIPV